MASGNSWVGTADIRALLVSSVNSSCVMVAQQDEERN